MNSYFQNFSLDLMSLTTSKVGLWPELHVLTLFGNVLEFLLDILPLNKLQHLSLANIRIVADESKISECANRGILKDTLVQIEALNDTLVQIELKVSFCCLWLQMQNSSYPLLTSALAKIMQVQGNRMVVGKETRQWLDIFSIGRLREGYFGYSLFMYVTRFCAYSLYVFLGVIY